MHVFDTCAFMTCFSELLLEIAIDFELNSRSIQVIEFPLACLSGTC